MNILQIAGITLMVIGIVLIILMKTVPSKIQISNIKAEGPVGLALVVAGLSCLFAGSISNINRSLPTSSTSASPSVLLPSGTSSAVSPSATLEYPANGTRVSKKRGFTTGGMYSSLGSDTIWILDHERMYIVDQQAVTAGGKWSALDQPLGTPSDQVPFTLTIVAVFADPSCASRLRVLNQSVSGDHTPELPPGCTPFGQVTVNVTQPLAGTSARSAGASKEKGTRSWPSLRSVPPDSRQRAPSSPSTIQVLS